MPSQPRVFTVAGQPKKDCPGPPCLSGQRTTTEGRTGTEACPYKTIAPTCRSCRGGPVCPPDWPERTGEECRVGHICPTYMRPCLLRLLTMGRIYAAPTRPITPARPSRFPLLRCVRLQPACSLGRFSNNPLPEQLDIRLRFAVVDGLRLEQVVEHQPLVARVPQ